MEPLKHQHPTCMEDSGICFSFPFKNTSNTLPCPHLNEYSSYLSNPFPTTRLVRSLFGGWCILCQEKPANKIQLAKPKQKTVEKTQSLRIRFFHGGSLFSHQTARRPAYLFTDSAPATHRVKVLCLTERWTPEDGLLRHSSGGEDEIGNRITNANGD